MKDHLAKVAANRVGLILGPTVATFAFLTALATPILAQSQPPRPPNSTNPERARQQEMSKREWQLRNIGIEPEKAASDPRHAQAVMDQVEQDFKRILTLHNELARTLSAGRILDYNFVSDAAGEIKKRASRLQTNLALPKPVGDQQDQEKRQEYSETQMTDALTLLCRQIESFVKNPIIATPGTVDAQQLARARRDLEGVVEVSGNVRKSADKLKKTSQ